LDVTGSSVLVTGGASGLGRATAARMARQGARVVVLDVPSQGAAAAAAAVGAQFCPADVTDPAGVRAALECAADLAPLRLVVNCAGIATPARVLRQGEPASVESFARVVQVNLIGSFNVLRLAAALMAANDPDHGDRGVIVNTSSVAAFDGQVGQAAYSASKGGIAAMTLALARDLAEYAIRVVAIAPGMFDTALLAGLPQAATASLARQVPHPARLGDPAEFAALVAHVAENGMLNGEVIRLDGALRMAPR
jgi:NAD(P)-dependent dehydrogenase (short-subunit alcohol dehydrogenase family)